MKEVISAIGRRKEAVARIFLTSGAGNIKVNGFTLEEYFPTEAQCITIRKVFDLAELLRKYDIMANIKGGGKSGQAGALRLAIARAAVKINPSIKKSLKTAGLLVRDSRMKERKKYGQKKARKKFQYSKR